MGQVSGSAVGFKVCMAWMESVLSVESRSLMARSALGFDAVTALTVLVDTVPSAPAQVQQTPGCR